MPEVPRRSHEATCKAPLEVAIPSPSRGRSAVVVPTRSRLRWLWPSSQLIVAFRVYSTALAQARLLAPLILRSLLGVSNGRTA